MFLQVHSDKEKEINALGIQMVKSTKKIGILNQSESDTQKKIEADNQKEGLIGEGLINDRPRKTVIMS